MFSELGRALSICQDCTRRDKGDSFQRSKKYKTLTKYLQQLRTFGSDFGDLQVHVNDIMHSTDPKILMYRDKVCMNEVIRTGKVFILFTITVVNKIRVRYKLYKLG